MQWNRACQADVHQINYLSHFYCAHDDGRALVALGFIGESALLLLHACMAALLQQAGEVPVLLRSAYSIHTAVVQIG